MCIVQSVWFKIENFNQVPSERIQNESFEAGFG